MPIYEYKCSHCQHQAEKLESISADKQQICPECGHNTWIRQISRSNFQLQGQGWYVTDFKDDKNKQAAETADTKDGKESTKDNDPGVAAEQGGNAQSSAAEKNQQTASNKAEGIQESKESKETKKTKGTKGTKEAKGAKEANNKDKKA